MIDQSVDYFYGISGPTPKQVEFRDSIAKYKLFGGAVGGGKTRTLCAESLRLSMMFPGNRGFLCRHEGEAFRKTTLVSLLSLIEEIQDIIHAKILVGHNKTDKEITLITNSVIMYAGIGDVDAATRIQSLEIGFFGVDEASETDEGSINMLKARLRHRLPSKKYPTFFGLFASNPGAGWLKDEFVTPHKGGNPRSLHHFVQALPMDNPWLPEGYIEELRDQNPKSWVDRFVDGSWDALQGQVYPNFEYNTHVLPNEKLAVDIPDWNNRIEGTIFGALDHGTHNPTCFLAMSEDFDGNIFVWDEYYSAGLVSEHAKRIASRLDTTVFSYMVADPHIWDSTSEKDGKPWSVAQEYGCYGFSFLKANNKVDVGVNRVGGLLHVDSSHVHPFTGKLGSPRLFISTRCPSLIKEIQNYVWKKQKDDSISDQPKKTKDHAVDALRYGVMSRGQLYKPVQKTLYNTFNQVKKDMNIRIFDEEGLYVR